MKELVNVNVPKPKGVDEVTAPEVKRKTVAERIVDAKEDALVLEATTKAHGLGQGGSGGAEQPESLAVQIVTNSMKQQQEAVKDMKEDEKNLHKELKEANAAVGEMQGVMMQDMLTRIEKAQTKLDASAETAKGKGAPVSAFDGYKQVKGELQTLVGELQKNQPAAEEHKSGMSDATQIRLAEIASNQANTLAQIQSDNARAERQFSLQMQEFQDTRTERREEYKDKRHFREEGLQGVSDLVAALGAGVSAKGGPAISKEGDEVIPQSESGEAEAGAYISSFKCSVCGGEIPVEEGQTVAKCPNPSCNASFTIKAKG